LIRERFRSVKDLQKEYFSDFNDATSIPDHDSMENMVVKTPWEPSHKKTLYRTILDNE